MIRSAWVGAPVVALLSLAACGGDPSGDRGVPQAGGAGLGGAGGSAPIDAGNPEPRDGAADTSDGGMMCGLAGCGQTITGHGGTVDMLFVIDDSHSMLEEQTSLAEEFPRLMRKLTSGDHDEDGEAEYQPVEDLHIGVVSTDLGGAVGVEKCSGSGHSGLLLHRGSAAGCEREFPTFLTYRAGEHDADQVAADFACLAQLGVQGCGFEQPLESALKALWPSADPTLRFNGFTTEESLGRGDRENAGFLRNDPKGPATLAIVVVTDEDDCSAFDPRLWTPKSDLDPMDPLAAQDLNLRCFYNPQSKYDLERYAVGYRALHGWTGARVLFAAIVGVPVRLVDQVALAEVDWNDDAQREAHYDTILSDPQMQEVPREMEPGSGYLNELTPSCEAEGGIVAYPPRRIVSLAREFGPNSLIQSICGDNLGPPIDIVIRRVLEGPQ